MKKSNKIRQPKLRNRSLFNTGQQIHVSKKGKGSYIRNKGELRRSWDHDE